jgi:hypothetical protein
MASRTANGYVYSCLKEHAGRETHVQRKDVDITEAMVNARASPEKGGILGKRKGFQKLKFLGLEVWLKR